MYIDRDEYKASFHFSVYKCIYGYVKKKRGKSTTKVRLLFLAIPVSAGSLAHTPTHMEQKTQREIETPSISMQSMCVCVYKNSCAERERERERDGE